MLYKICILIVVVIMTKNKDCAKLQLLVIASAGYLSFTISNRISELR